MTWDIEVFMKDGKFDINGKNMNNKVICICGSFGTLNGSSAEQYCITTADNNPVKNNDTWARDKSINYIVATDEGQMIVELFHLILQKDPVFITGFNDSAFDLPYIQDKIDLFNVGPQVVKQLVRLFATSDIVNDLLVR